MYTFFGAIFQQNVVNRLIRMRLTTFLWVCVRAYVHVDFEVRNYATVVQSNHSELDAQTYVEHFLRNFAQNSKICNEISLER